MCAKKTKQDGTDFRETVACSQSVERQKTFLFSQVILASGYYAAFRVTLVAKALEGTYDGAVHLTTDYEVGWLVCSFQAVSST